MRRLSCLRARSARLTALRFFQAGSILTIDILHSIPETVKYEFELAGC